MCATAAHQHPSIQLTGAEAFLYFAFSNWQTRMRSGRTAAAGPAEDLLRCWRAGGRLLTFITHDGLKPSFISSQRWKGSQQVPMILLPSVPLWLYASVTLTPLIPPWCFQGSPCPPRDPTRTTMMCSSSRSGGSGSPCVACDEHDNKNNEWDREPAGLCWITPVCHYWLSTHARSIRREQIS